MKGKKVKAILTLLIVVVLAISISVPVLAAANDNNGLGRYIVVFEPGVNDAAKAKVGQIFGSFVDKPLAILGNANVVWVPQKAVEAFSKRSEILRIEEDVMVYASPKPPGTPGKPPKDESPPQPAEDLPWGVDRIDADMAWDTATGTGVNVAVIDTGIDSDHPDLSVKGGINFVGKGPYWKRTIDSTKWDDDNGHGTHVAGTIAAIDNEIGVIGVAPEANLYAVKVLDKSGSGYVSDVVAGIQWATENNIDIINMSLGSSSDVPLLQEACDKAAFEFDIIIVAAAGNDYGGSVNYPAAYSSVIAVSATDSGDSLASFSNTGKEVEIAAPGVNILSTWNDGSYNTISGTSMATPHVTGTVALILDKYPGLSPDDIRLNLQDSAENLGPVGWDSFFGYGLVDAEEAVTLIESDQ